MLVASEVGVALLDLYNSVQRAAELLKRYFKGLKIHEDNGAEEDFLQ